MNAIKMNAINRVALFLTLATVFFVIGGMVGCTTDLIELNLEKSPESPESVLDIKPI